MKLREPLLRLPLRLDADRLAREVEALPASAWLPHPNNFPGNAAVPLVSPHGAITDAVAGPMAATPHLAAMPYARAVMAGIGAVWGRSRLMRLAPGAVVPRHSDIHYYWRTHNRIHIPVVTNPAVSFSCGGETVHMAAGECWIFDTWQQHEVRNAGEGARVHLVLDTVGGEGFWDLVEAARADPSAVPRTVAPGEAGGGALLFEKVNKPGVMTPWEVRSHIAFIAEEARPDPLLPAVLRRLDRFAAGWTGAWAQFGADAAGFDTYRALLASVQRDLDALGGGRLLLDNGIPVYRELALLIFTVALPA